MRNSLGIVHLMVAASSMLLPALAADQISLTQGTSGTWNADWSGSTHRTDFIQWSLDLENWHFAPVVEYGPGAKNYGFISSTDKFFVRLQHAFIPSSDPEGADYDSDDLTNIDEVTLHDTDPLDWDTDGDRMADGWEVANGLSPRDDGSIDPANGPDADPDHDGVINSDEHWHGANPHLSDTDGDGLSDSDECYIYFTYPEEADTDQDGLNDYAEIITYSTDPLWWDTDKDRLSDGDETLVYGTNPLLQDSDGDWMPDDWELDKSLDPTNPADGLHDPDSDGVPNKLEYLFMDKGFNPFVHNSAAFPWNGDPDWDDITTADEFNIHLTNPRQPDTDRDKLGDGWEIQYGFPAKIHNSTDVDLDNDAQADPDGDNLTNEQESAHGTNPTDPDTDGDGVNDDVEINQGSNPNDPNNLTPPPGGTVTVSVHFGDPSDSHSEKYTVVLLPLEGDTQERKRTNRDYGQTQTDSFHLPKGAKYSIQLRSAGSDPELRGTPKPDYDYILEFVNSEDAHLVIKDDQGILGLHNESHVFFAGGKEAIMHVPLFEWITPKGSPVTEPKDIGEGKNEFVYDSSPDAEMLLNLKILVKPTGTAEITDDDGVKFADRCIFSLPEIAGSTFAWNIENSGGKAKADGQYLIARATYTTLPSQNSSFGLKEAAFTCDGDQDTIADADFEIFYMKDATNHPGGQANSPNWFHFWKQFVPVGRIGDLTYNNNIGDASGSTIARFRTTKISQRASETNVETGHQGLHNFYETTVHESYHITLWEGWWGIDTAPNPALDTDADTYPNSFETSTEGIIYGFNPSDINDLYNPNTNSAGFRYEEEKCIEQERLIQDVTAFDSQDWSFGLTIKGKNQ